YFTGLTEIPADGFNYCSSLKKITPPPSVTSIGENAFYYCSQLTDFDFTHIKRIDSYAFNRAGLTHVTLPSTVEYIGYASFYLTTNGCTVHLDHNSIDVYNGFEPYGSPTSGIIFPIVGADDTLEVNRGYFHEAYTTCPFNYRKAVTPYVTHEDGFLPFTTLSCEAPLKLTDPDVEVYIITGFNPTRYVFTTKRYNGEVLPANKGVLLRFKDISGRYYAFPQATAYEGTFDFGQNLLSASTQFTTIGSDDDYWNFSTVSWYNGSETDYKNWTLAYVPSGNPTSSNACEAYLRLPKSLFDESGMDVGEGAMIEVDFSLVGDVNEDDELGVADITKLVNLILSSEVNDHSDVNCDGETGVADLTKLVNILLEE
ncbi:MAG: leucine-rich repeat protein, partial [Muribaculaceae bacterium]|nr:leucine-rich repeat protein [Muribaculaceae bacterium]